jgi:type III pantothenate kinase
MNLVIDIGNTSTKIAVFEDDEMVFNDRFRVVRPLTIDKILERFKISQTIISTVKAVKEQWHDVLAKKTSLAYFAAKMAKNISNHYLTPETLGPDRLAGVMGARVLYPGQDNLVISGGTCITYDWIGITGNYFGGSISPGLKMRYKALHNYTAGLPLLSAGSVFEADYGDNTANAIHSGVQNGIKYELEGFVESYKTNVQYLNIILTGGDSIFFDTLLKNSIFAPCVKNEPFLVLEGLNAAIHNNND